VTKNDGGYYHFTGVNVKQDQTGNTKQNKKTWSVHAKRCTELAFQTTCVSDEDEKTKKWRECINKK
jgi:hypothetical protein